MSATIIDGKLIAAGLRERIGQQVASFKKERDIKPCLAVVLVGDDPASHVYVRNKVIACEKAGMTSIKHRLEAETSEKDVIALVRSLNEDEGVDGILVQMPLPDHINALQVISEIHPYKDVDGLTQISAGCVLLGQQGLVPCTPQGSIMLLKTVHDNLSGMTAVVLGRSILVGKPLGLLLLEQNCTVTMAHSRTKDLPALCRSADIICAAVGRPEMVRGDWIKPGATIIDVGINRVEREGKMRLVGDVDFTEAQAVAGAITPVPGGVGPMTIACLLRNTLIAACRRRGLQDPNI